MLTETKKHATTAINNGLDITSVYISAPNSTFAVSLRVTDTILHIAGLLILHSIYKQSCVLSASLWGTNYSK